MLDASRACSRNERQWIPAVERNHFDTAVRLLQGCPHLLRDLVHEPPLRSGIRRDFSDMGFVQESIPARAAQSQRPGMLQKFR